MDWSPDDVKSISMKSFTLPAITHSLPFSRMLYWSLRKLERERRNALTLKSLPQKTVNSAVTNCDFSVSLFTGVQLAAHLSHMDRANYCHGMSSSHCFEPATLAAVISLSYLTSKTDLLTSPQALRKLLTSKANLTLSSHPSLTISINSLNRLESICVRGFFSVVDNQLHASWAWRHGNHSIQEAAIRQPSCDLFCKEAADSIWNEIDLKKTKPQRQMEGWSKGGSR